MQGYGEDIDNDALNAATNKLANLSVCEERSPLKDSPQFGGSRSPQSCLNSKRVLSSGSESGMEGQNIKETQARFNKLVKRAKHLAHEGKVQQAVELNKEALKIHYHDKLARRIAKMEEYLKQREDDEEEEEETDGGMIQLGPSSGFYLHKDLNAKLYNHQKQGVLWMWTLHRKKKGGILGDDMGLGKTIQVIAFLSGLIDMDRVQTVMVVMPVSVMVNWEKEFNKWAPGIKVHSFYGTSKKERDRCLERVQRRGGVLLTTYGLVLTSWEQLTQKNGREFVWDYVILDEGHKIKNANKTTKAIHNVAATHRIILTGTPVQNNLKELWTLFDYVHQGSLLGTLRTFKMEFENPIIRARERDATGGEKRLGLEMAETLKKIIDPFFLRRTKAQVKQEENKSGSSEKTRLPSMKMPTMTFKNDFVVWLYLSDAQLGIYRDFLQLDSVKELLMSSKSPLVALNVLKKICDHPRLLSIRACHELGLEGHSMAMYDMNSLESAVTKIDSLSDDVLIGEAGKAGVLISLVDQLREEGHRTLVFSQSRKMLDILQRVLKNRGHKVMRLDGTVKTGAERDHLVQKFQNNTSYSVFLLTTQVGGVGLTLTAADRVIIYDPNWNPATDAQAVDRAFRIGQTKNVVIYRLITCGTVEEKIYRRQVFKDSITRQATGNTKDPYRYFTKQELHELFQLEEPRFSNTQRQLEEMHGLDRRRDSALDQHIVFLHTLDIFGISDHDLMFSQESPADETEEMVPSQGMPDVMPQHEEYIKHRVQKAQEIIARESSVPGTMEQRQGSSNSTASLYSGVSHNMHAPHPQGSDSNYVMLNRPGGGVTVFKPKQADSIRHMMNRLPAKKPQEVIVYPPKPTQSQANSSRSSAGSSVSDPIDLTADEDVKIDLSSLQLTSAGAVAQSELPHLKKKTEKSVSSPASQEGDGPHAEGAGSTKNEEEVFPPTPESQSLGEPASSSTPRRPEKKRQHEMCSTPKSNIQRVVEEELIISPTSYTPLMMVRQKRRRVTQSPVNDLCKSLAESVFVADSPELDPAEPNACGRKTGPSSAGGEGDTVNETAEEIASFLAEDDLLEVQESFMEEGGEEDTSPVQSASGDVETEMSSPTVSDDGQAGGPNSKSREQSSASEDSDPFEGVKTKRRRSVCRRMAVIESSEDEVDEDEDKENRHPSFTRNTSQHDDIPEDDDEEMVEDDDLEEGDDAGHGEEMLEDNRDDGGDCDEEEGDEVEDGDDEEEDIQVSEDGEVEKVGGDCGDESNDGQGGEEDEESSEEGTDQAVSSTEEDPQQQAEGQVAVFDESLREDREDEDEGDEEEDEEELDEELLQQLLKDGKYFYRQKKYPEALEKCNAALAMLYDPQLEAMIVKIQSKIDQGL